MSESVVRREIIIKLTVVFIAVALFAVIIIARVLFLQIVQHDKWINANTITQKDIIIEPDRGDVCDANGRILATSVPFYEIRMDMGADGLTRRVFERNIDSLSLQLSKLFGDKSEQQYRSQLTNAWKRNDRYYLIKRRVDYLQLKRLKNFPIFRLGQYKGGLIIIQENVRIQPFVSLASRTIGYQTESGTQVGIEGAFDEELRGEKGVRLVQRIAGNYWMPVNDGNQVEPRNGYDVITTIDVSFQDVAHNALYRQLDRHSASHGTAILMEVKTGDVKAIVNLKRDSNGEYTEQFNYAIGERTEPGSTFKLATLMVALEDGYIELDDTINTGNGEVKYHDQVVRDTKEEGFGRISVKEVFELSSNVGVTKIITKHYSGKEEQFVRGLKRMGLMEPLNLDIKGERQSYIKFPDDELWSGVSLPQMSYGYEVEQTPLAILTFYNAVANNGQMLRPRFVKKITEHGDVKRRISPKVINPSICSRATIAKAKIILEGVVENGTAQNLKAANYKIAGKTGTAQIANQKYGYKYQSKISYQASFVGYFPADNPKYSCIVVVNAPTSGVYYGNLVAGQVFKEIADKVYATNIDLHENNVFVQNVKEVVPYTRKGSFQELETVLDELEIPFNSEGIKSDWVATERSGTEIKLYNRYINKQLVPDVKGMGAKDALFVLENLGLQVFIQGRGSVGFQSISPGSRFNEGDRIVLKLI